MSLTYEERLQIRRYYEPLRDAIESSVTMRPVGRWHPWWLPSMTPIERMAYEEAAIAGLQAYSEYPIGRFWADLAIPSLRVAIEADGAAYHDNEERDCERDREIWRAHGWIVLRVTGSECYRNWMPPHSDDADVWLEYVCHGGINGLMYGLRRVQDDLWFEAVSDASSEGCLPSDIVPMTDIVNRYSLIADEVSVSKWKSEVMERVYYHNRKGESHVRRIDRVNV